MSSVDEELPETLPRWEIPSDWQWVSIVDVGKVITGNTPPTKDESNYGNHIPFVKPPALTDKGIRSTPEGLSETGVRSSRTLPAGAVLVSCIGGLGKTGIAKVPVAFNQQINAIVFDQRVIPEFGFYYAQTLKPWLHGVASATTLPIVNKGKFQRAPFPLAPLDQQKRIVAEIEKQFSRLDQAVANLKRVKANLKRYKAAVLKSAVEGRLVETEAERARREGRSYETGAQLLQRTLETRRSQWKGKGKYKEPAAPDTTDLPELPEGWVWASVDQLTSGSLIGLDRGRDQQNSEGVGVPYVKMNNVTMEGDVTSESMVYVAASDEEKRRFNLQVDDLLFNTRNSKELVGKVGIVRSLQKDAIYNNNLMRLRLSGGAVPSFICYQMCSDGFRRRMELVKKATTNVAAVYAKDLFPLPLALPPVAEQLRIVAEIDRCLSLIRKTEAQVAANLQRTDFFRRSTLAKAFSPVPAMLSSKK